MSDSLPSDAPRPRLCHVRKWPDFNGYGFNLHAERGKAGQFIGTVDPESPSVAANLRAGDRIIEVNGTNINSENHQQVVQRIKAVPGETRLLVVDEETDNYYKEHKVIVRGDMDNVEVCETPVTNPFTHQTTETDAPGNAVEISDTETDAPGNAVEISDTGDDDDDDVTAQTMTSDTVDHVTVVTSDTAGASAEHVARLCQLKTWPNFAGYGFNLHADRATPGQYVGKVDDGSPAEAAGLRLNDRIVEVNGCSVDGKSHAEVVSAIKSVVGQVRLLVVDAAADEFYRENGVEISASLADIEHIVCPDDKPHLTAVNGQQEASMPVTQAAVEVDSAADIDSTQCQQEITHDDDDDDMSSQQQEHSAVMENVSSSERVGTVDELESDSRARADVNVPGPLSATRHADNVGGLVTASRHSQPDSVPVSGRPVVVGGIEFASSAKEARERMKKKANVKQGANLSLRDKYELLQKL